MKQRLCRLLKELRPGAVLVVGDVILDRYLKGTVERISPEAPVEVFEVADECQVLGGAANVAANVAALGAGTRLIGVVGSDSDAKSMRALLKKQGIRNDGLVTDSSRPTTRKTRIMALRQQMLRVDMEKRHDVSREIGEKMLARIEKAVGACDGAIVSDYGKGALPAWLLKKLFTMCKKAGIPVIVDPKGRDYSKYVGATIITPNRKEAAAAAGIDITEEKDYEEAARRLFETTKVNRLVITRGAEGMSLFDGPGPGLTLPAEALEVFDVSGAGDTVIAVLGALLFSGLALEDAARLANMAAAIEVGHVGAWPIGREEILARLRKDGPGDGKSMTRAQAAMFTAKQRAANKKVVFTNGCFDLLHAGHVRLLKEARAVGDALIVGINSDSSVRRLKGENRPLLNEMDRLEILAALDCVDAVVVFDEDTPLKLIRAIKPDTLVKGSDYRISDVIGRDVVEAYGGNVKLIPLLEGKSSTNLIKTILKNHTKKTGPASRRKRTRR